MSTDKENKTFPAYLICPACHELYQKPKYLSCLHAFCEECLEKLQTDSDLTCVVCNKKAKVPSKGLKELPNHTFFTRLADEVAIKHKIEQNEDVSCSVCDDSQPAISLCPDCGELLCKDCSQHHAKARKSKHHTSILLEQIRSEKKDIPLLLKPTVTVPETPKCQNDDHDLDLIFYCETCKYLICMFCKDDTTHTGHKVGPVNTMAKKHLSTIIDEELVGDMIDKVATSEDKISSTSEKIESQADEVEQEIDAYFDQVEQNIKKQRENSKRELREVSVQKRKALALQLKQLKHLHAQLECTKKLSEAVKDRSDNQEGLFMKKQITDDVKRLEQIYKDTDTEPVEIANINFSKENEQPFPFFGNLSYGKTSLLNTAVMYTPAYGYVGKEVELTITTKDDNHHPCQTGGSKITAQAKPRTGDVITAEVKDNQDGSYTATFVPTQPGEVEVSVIFEDKKINEKFPLSVMIHQHSAIDKPGKLINYEGKMGSPWGIAFGKDSVWAVADYSNHRVCIFDKADQTIKNFGSSGNGNGQFSNPCGLGLDAGSNLYVVDHGNHRIQKFDSNGNYLLQFGKKGSGTGELNNPLGITVYNDNVFVADQTNKRISLFQCNGQFSHTFGSDHLQNPYDVAVTNSNQVLVADYGHHCISIFTIDGNYVNKIGTQGSDRGQLSCPSSLCIDLYGFILVTEYSNNRVSIFDKDGVFIHCFGSSGSSAGQFSSPCGIACSPNGSVYVSDYNNKRIQIFSNYQ